ncbi:cytochrome C oxidase subunit II [Sinorhizobium meliloti]|uniref:cytochrome c oxidase subunit II n=1 Tax=Rhizobium meliloti TaxID=382 RepID=UPI000FD7F2DE|nr:c-type cytochrome [Sinorhizobium meliloti]MDW9445522.1 c-type cytochrome [Sinorhizobium meliloti]MDW9520629.1 c-type cytochrome [Sinorhizobium meliloti]MDW9522812.1 c-type cytochrome [Sinorhizobium meliloti]MDW9577348.1 c-type cytochrome [Sinorhizobium meliloti]MDW9638627.1 c-type cytochrome [Sinorhizobium meliloti]
MRLARYFAAASALALQGCAGLQSALDPSGAEAERIGTLSWLLVLFSTAILVAVCLITAVALFGGERWRARIAGERIVIGGGLVFPILALSVLLIYGFYLMSPGTTEARSQGALRIEVVGERWWWRVTYVDEAGRRIESANEIRLPVGRPVELELTSADVIHSFWVPRLAGKLDMIPGHTNTLTLQATKAGISRGQCAEYCGGPHAFMSFYVIAMPDDQFSSWLAGEAGDASAAKPDQAAGQALFLSSGCAACHRVRGTDARGTIGPDLTHVGSRHSLAAATLENDVAAFVRWIRDGQHVKPENLMPPFEIFTDDELRQLAAYLDQLR